MVPLTQEAFLARWPDWPRSMADMTAGRLRFPEFDPDEPLVVRWEDVIAARNVAAVLGALVSGWGHVDGLLDAARFGVTAGLPEGESDLARVGESQEELRQWVIGVRDRLNGALPQGEVTG